MENEFTEVMSQRTDEELINIVTVQRDDYNPIAVEVAENEIKRRGIDTSEFEEIGKKIIVEIEKKEKIDKNNAKSFLRLINLLIDTASIFIIIVIISFFIQPIGKEMNHFLSLIISIGTYIIYYLVLEIQFNKTIGKFLTKTKVVTVNEQKPNKSDIITRTFCRLIPLGKISFLFTKNGFHDNFSDTKVINDR